jgi:tetratricopeptide (TPR) repeat protein
VFIVTPCDPQADEIVEKVYANMSACHIKRENWKRAQETAEKALAKNPKNYKAIFRRGKALGEQGFFERAEKILEELIKESPTGKLTSSHPSWVTCCYSVTHLTSLIHDSDAPAATAELKRLRAIDKEREKVHNQKMRGMYIHGLAKCCCYSGHLLTGWLNRGGLQTPTGSSAEVVEEITSPGTEEARSAGAT